MATSGMTKATKWPADKVERRALEALIPDARNARKHSSEQIAQIAGSMKEWGWTSPVLVDEGDRIIAGHGRVLAAGRLGFAEVPVMVAEGWTAAQKRAYIIADNQLALSAEWDMELLASEVQGLAEWNFDLSLLGFSDLDDLLARGGNGLTDPDEVPPVPKQPVSQPGDLWVLGRHRLLCGDSTVATDVERVLGGVEPHLMVTDPPYGVDYDPDWRNRAEGEGGFGDPVKSRAGYKSSRAIGQITNDNSNDWREAWTLFPGDVAYVWHAGRFASQVQASLQAALFEIRCQVIWAKSHFAISRGHYHWQHEPCWYAVRKGKPGHWTGDRSQTTLWQIDHRKSETGHSAQKPVECMRRPIENNSSLGQAVYDPFVGSGTTIIAAQMTGRACHAIEIAPAYVDVALQRWQDFTGNAATLDGDGRTFSELAAERERKAA
jgi:DNA modification methylase